MISEENKIAPLRKCPYCGKPMTIVQKSLDNPFFPFCSKRCKMADLDKWFSGEHAISQGIEELDDQQIAELLDKEINDV